MPPTARAGPNVSNLILSQKNSGQPTVYAQLGVSDNLLDLTLLLEIGERSPCERAVNLETIDEGGYGDEAVGLDILLELVGDGLVENDSVIGLVLDCGGCQWRFASNREV